MFMSSGELVCVMKQCVHCRGTNAHTNHTLIVLLQIVVASVGGVEGAYSMDKKWAEE